jgi:DNA-binding GntR family transcriptional regulator
MVSAFGVRTVGEAARMIARKTPSSDGRSSVVLTRVIYERLRDEIVSGQLKPAELLSRRQIARRYGCSYTPVIEALIRLESAGLVETESNQMARVRGLSIERIRSDYILREACETQAIRLACESAASTELDGLSRLADEVDATVKKGHESHFQIIGDGPLLHRSFHRRIAELGRCPALVAELERIELLGRLKANWIFVEDLPDPPRHHGHLADAIRRRDPIAADAVMRAHVRRGLEKELQGYRRAQARS